MSAQLTAALLRRVHKPDPLLKPLRALGRLRKIEQDSISIAKTGVMDFQDRLERAIKRGNRTADARVQAEVKKTMSAEELKTLHSKCRLELSDHIESCLKMLADRFPGFDYSSILNDDGWGGRITRDDISVQPGSGSQTLYSRLEMTIRPLGSVPIVELVGKATIRNKETFTRNHYHQLEEIDIESFREMIDLWVLEFAEQFAAAAK